MFFHCLAPRDSGEQLLAALNNKDLTEIDRLLNLIQPIEKYKPPRPDLCKALPEACRAGLKSFVQKWIASGTNLDPETCQKLLKPAVVSGSIESVETLLKLGANLNLLCSCHNSVLVVAIACLDQPDLMKMVQYLVERGANINRNFGEYSPLLMALLEQPDVMLYLLQNGADVNEAGNIAGNTPLTAAVNYVKCEYRYSKRFYSTVSTLLSAGADPNKPNNFGETALHWAKDTEIIRLLIQAGADIEARNNIRRTPLLEATASADVISVLKSYGADMAAVDSYGDSALHIMARRHDDPQEETFQLFAFQCNQINKHGMTPLMLAAQSCHEKAVRILLKLGTDPNIVTYTSGEPQTALSLVLDRIDENLINNSNEACAEELITHHSMTSLYRCRSHFFKMIIRDQRRLVQLMVTHGMAPLCEDIKSIVNKSYVLPWTLRHIPCSISPLASALVLNKLAIAQYLTENWFLTPTDLVGSMELRYLKSELERRSQTDGLRFMDENLSQPMSLLKLCFAAVSAQLVGVVGREERVRQTPLPNILKDKLLFRRENFPMDFTEWNPTPVILLTFDESKLINFLIYTQNQTKIAS
ncbi:ankyrin repeat protein [Plakobranchus ocellatus]|uniref:Ankyrin repeat protein n=1 Tax=Plakobranchus ocellatus TaxID=259542 RepID=A0AAV3ZIV8_9GAST|nr:ankyrin repeat protein [Plakobranchus ocellatus]